MPENRQDKLRAKSQKFTFVGLNDSSTAWRYYNPGLRQVLTSRNVIFSRAKPYDLPLADMPNLEGENYVQPALPEDPPAVEPVESKVEQVKEPATVTSTRTIRSSPRQVQRVDYQKLHKIGRAHV